MLKTRVIPVLLLKDRGLVKTRNFKNPTYLGDPKNIVRLFNDKEVDELVILDITATKKQRPPDFQFLKELAVECFMPVCYGGGINHSDDIKKLFALGIEKVAINSYAFENPGFIKEIATVFGSQSIVVSIDVKKNLFGHDYCFTRSGSKNTHIEPDVFARHMAENGAGELLINSINADGTMSGYDLPMIKKITASVSIPVIACGGAGSLDDFRAVVLHAGAAAAAAGSFFVFQGIHRAVLISYPPYAQLEALFN